MKSFTIATWNVNSLRVRLPHVLAWLKSVAPDVLVLQEIKCLTEKFPDDEIRDAGYEAIVSGQKTYNGVAILIKNRAGNEVVTDFPDWQDPGRRMLAVTVDHVRVINLYVPNGESLVSEKYQYKLTWLKQLTLFLKAELNQYSKVIVLGDFNIAPTDHDVYDPNAWQGRVLFSEPERAAFQTLLALGFVDCFRLFQQPDESYSWWDYRIPNALKRNMGLRIDHILASKTLANQCKRCVIDPAPRAWERPSDHAPVLAEFVV